MISPTIRQLIVIGACLLGALSSGGAMGYPMVLLHQLSREDSPINLTLDTSSWIGSMHGLAGIASVIVPTFMQRIGRKSAFSFGCICVLLGWLVAFNATSVTLILISELIHGFGTNSLFVLGILSMSEMTSPTFRNLSVQSYGILQALGMATSGILSAFLGWKYVCVVMSIPIIIAFFLSLLWPESPSWLACKGRFDDCYEAYKQLRVIDTNSKIELEELIAAQKENLLRDRTKERSCAFFLAKIRRRDFYLPALHVILLLFVLYWSGCAVVIVNSFDLIHRMTNNDTAPIWGGIVINSVFFIGMFLSSVLNKRFNNKTILLTSIVCTSTCLIGMSLVILSQSIGMISEQSLLGTYLLIAYVGLVSLGIIPIIFTLVSELMPVKHRGLGGVVYVVANSTLYASAMKVSPYLFSYINVWGTFLLYTLNTSIGGLLICIFVPETKNKTLQQIEDFYMFGTFNKNRTQYDEGLYVENYYEDHGEQNDGLDC